MNHTIHRRTFLHVATMGSAACLGVPILFTRTSRAIESTLISPGCRKSKVKVAKIYLGKAEHHWPTPLLDVAAEAQSYEEHFKKIARQLADVEFVVSDTVSSPEDVAKLRDAIGQCDGILAIQLCMGVSQELGELLKCNKPVFLFAAPYSGHEWVGYGGLRQENPLFDCVLTSDRDEMLAGIRAFRAIHHLREAKVLNVTSRELPADYVSSIQEKFGTEILRVDRDRMLKTYDSISDEAAEEEAMLWIEHAVQVVEPPRDEIVRSCKMALAFEKLLDEEEATVITVDCYGTMYHNLPAFPCIGFTRLNDRGLGGICESDLRCAMTHIVMQGLSGKPGFISDPTMDTAKKTAILAHCLGSTKMNGPQGERAPYKLRTIMERQEGAVPQVQMRIGERVTQAILTEPSNMLYFTGTIVEAPDIPRGCRTKIAVEVDGDADKLWQNWSNGLHRVTCYGDIASDLNRFCRYKGIGLTCEA